MVDDESQGLGPGPSRLRSLSEILLDRVADLLEGESRRHGGSLDTRQMRAVVDGFKCRVDDDSIDFYRTGWNECLAVIDEVRRESGRRMPFERLVIRPVAHLLPAPNQPAVAGRGLSRRIVPGFLLAIHQMLGPVLLEQYQTRCRELVRIIQTARGNDFDWEDVYTDPTSQVIVNDVLVHVSKHFTDLPRRRDWLIDIIRSEMPLGDDEAERGWTFGAAEFRLLMGALFRPLRDEMASPEGRQRMRDRYGTIACEVLADLFDDLDRMGNVTLVKRSGTGP